MAVRRLIWLTDELDAALARLPRYYGPRGGDGHRWRAINESRRAADDD